MSIEPTYDRRMSHAEAVLLCRFAKAACPQQAFDQYTPDAWAELLSDLRFEDCGEAVTNVVRRQPFVAPAEIRDEVKRVRSKRIGDFGPLPDPPIGTDYDTGEYARWLRDLIRRIGDGEVTDAAQVEPFGELEAHDVIAELGHVGTAVDDDLAVTRRSVREAHEEARRELQAAAKPEPEPLLDPEDHSREPEPTAATPAAPTAAAAAESETEAS